MYSIKFTQDAQNQIRNLANISHKPKVLNALLELGSVPFKRAKKSKKPAICGYYVNVGSWYCILLDISEENQIVHVLSVMPQPKLHRLLND